MVENLLAWQTESTEGYSGAGIGGTMMNRATLHMEDQVGGCGQYGMGEGGQEDESVEEKSKFLSKLAETASFFSKWSRKVSSSECQIFEFYNFFN